MRCLLCLIVSVLAACSPVSRTALTRTFRKLESRFKHHAGFVLYNPQKDRIIFSYQGDRYFTPASNTKVLTFYTALNVLSDSIPALLYEIRDDSLIFCGTGDPSFLNPGTCHSPAIIDFLRNFQGQLYLADNPLYAPPLGPGWAWSDYRYSYSAERSSFPVYGNYFTVLRSQTGKTTVTPGFFKKYFWQADSTDRTMLLREWQSNRLEYAPARNLMRPEEWQVPFKTSLTLAAELLQDTLKKRVEPLPGLTVNRQNARIVYSVRTDSLCKTMMQESDNFISEQLLLMCAWVLTDSLKPEAAIRFMLATRLNDLPDRPVWVDGSGLSRYNRTTPRNNWYQASDNQKPYIFAKTGTLSNNHCLSGFLITRKNRVLIFSFMNSNYVQPVNGLRREMEIILKTIHDKL